MAHDDGNYKGRDEHVATAALARDPFTEALRRLKKNPEAVEGRARVDVMDDINGMTTWLLDVFKMESAVTALVQIGNPDGSYSRIVMPPQVMDALLRHSRTLIKKNQSKVGTRNTDVRRAAGLPVGNPEALAKARRARRKK